MKHYTLRELAQRSQTAPTPDSDCLESIRFFMHMSGGFRIDHVLTPENYQAELERLKQEYPVVQELHQKPGKRLNRIWVTGRLSMQQQ